MTTDEAKRTGAFQACAPAAVGSDHDACEMLVDARDEQGVQVRIPIAAVGSDHDGWDDLGAEAETNRNPAPGPPQGDPPCTGAPSEPADPPKRDFFYTRPHEEGTTRALTQAQSEALGRILK